MSETTRTTCHVHPDQPMIDGWQGPHCTLCEREEAQARGCLCGGSFVCSECAKARLSTGDANAKCSIDCDGLCAVCCPDS